MNDRVVHSVTVKPQKVVFNLTTSMQEAKATKQVIVDIEPPSNYSKRKPWDPRSKPKYTPLGKPLDVVYKTLLLNQICAPLDNSQPYDPQPRPSWWNESAYYDYHRNKGHKTMSCIQLWHKIQKLINNGDVIVGNHNKNYAHQVFKYLFPPHEKG